jgi:hypothetical protein
MACFDAAMRRNARSGRRALSGLSVFAKEGQRRNGWAGAALTCETGHRDAPIAEDDGETTMWRSSRLIGYGMRATDGSIGQINDFLFDEEAWTIRWAVIDTGSWLPGRKVLLPPAELGRPDVMRREIPVDLTREQIEGSPSLETDAPVSRRMEGEIYGY